MDELMYKALFKMYTIIKDENNVAYFRLTLNIIIQCLVILIIHIYWRRQNISQLLNCTLVSRSSGIPHNVSDKERRIYIWPSQNNI